MPFKPQPEVKNLLAERDRLTAEMEALRNKLAGLEMAIDIVREGANGSAGEAHHRKASVTETVLDLLRESAASGLRAEDAVSLAANRGFLLKRGSVSSLLSQLKRDGLVVYEDHRYKLAQFGRDPETGPIFAPGKNASDDESARHH